MKKLILIVVIIFALAIAATYYPWQQTEVSEPVAENSSVSEPDDFLKITVPDEKPDIKYPVPKVPSKPIEVESVDAEPASVEIPITTEPSDNDIAAAIKQLTEATGLFSFKSFIRHFVVTIDNMTNQKIPQRYIITQRVPETFAVIKQDVDTTVLDSNNFRRYSEFVNLAEQVNTRKLVVQYVRFYPLFQEAYEELGYPDLYFNDRFIQVIDHLLAAPEVKGTIQLIRPKVFYHFAKPDLEALSAGQKILVRIGYDNAQRVKTKLRELRTVLTTLSPS